tara:strand:+ start:3346 stop:3570 length:225 start_codon:yes stop_codon:yes gene_type:complete
MLKYFLWPTIGALSGSHLYLIAKGLYNKNKYHYMYSNDEFILNGGFLFGALLGCSYVYLDEPILSYFLRKYINN